MRVSARTPLIAVVVFALAGCSSSQERAHPRPPAPTTAPSSPEPGTTLVVGSPGEVAAIDAATGSVLYDGPGVLPAANRSVVVTTEFTDGMTSLRTVLAATGEVSATESIRGRLAVRVVSGDGHLAALMAPMPAGADLGFRRPGRPRPSWWPTLGVSSRPVGTT
jgi:hypothetical protein